MTNTDRSDFIDKDEALYQWWRGSGLSKREFILRNRRQIDAVISNVRRGRTPTNYQDQTKSKENQ